MEEQRTRSEVAWRNKLKRARAEQGARTAKGIDGEPLHGPRLNESDLVTSGAREGMSFSSAVEPLRQTSKREKGDDRLVSLLHVCSRANCSRQ